MKSKNVYLVNTKLIKYNGINILPNSVAKLINYDSNNINVLFIGKNIVLNIPSNFMEEINVNNTGKGFSKKICNICHILKNNEDFEINQTDAKGIKTNRPSCRMCRKDINGTPMMKDEEKRMESIKPAKNSIFKCPICEKTSIVGVTANLVKDHNHVTGKAREWICDSCNTGLGRFKDDIEILKRAIDYLNKNDN